MAPKLGEKRTFLSNLIRRFRTSWRILLRYNMILRNLKRYRSKSCIKAAFQSHFKISLSAIIWRMFRYS